VLPPSEQHCLGGGVRALTVSSLRLHFLHFRLYEIWSS